VKFVAVLNRKQPLVVLLNGLAHLALGICRDSDDNVSLSRFNDMEGKAVAHLSDYPFIVLSSRNGDRLRDFHKKLVNAGLPCNAFVTRMIEGEVEEQMNDISNSSLDDLDYVAVVAFGDDETLRDLTKQFSLFRDMNVNYS
jgi:hypothetical protein